MQNCISNVPFGPPAVRRGRLHELEEEVVLRGAVLLRVEVDVGGGGGGGGWGATSGSGGGGLSLGNALLGVGGRRLGPRCHGPRDGHPIGVVAGLKRGSFINHLCANRECIQSFKQWEGFISAVCWGVWHMSSLVHASAAI